MDGRGVDIDLCGRTHSRSCFVRCHFTGPFHTAVQLTIGQISDSSYQLGRLSLLRHRKVQDLSSSYKISCN